METLKILEKKENLNWEYDKEAVSLDLSEGVIVRYATAGGAELVGITIIGVKQRSLTAMAGGK